MYSCAVNPLLPRSPPRAIGAVHALASASGLTQRGAVTAIDPKMDSKMINARWDLHDVLRIRRRQIEERSYAKAFGERLRSGFGQLGTLAVGTAEWRVRRYS